MGLMAGISTGVNLLSGVGGMTQGLILWLDFESGSIYSNKLNSAQTVTSVTGFQSSSSPVSANLGSYHIRTPATGVGSGSSSFNTGVSPINSSNSTGVSISFHTQMTGTLVNGGIFDYLQWDSGLAIRNDVDNIFLSDSGTVRTSKISIGNNTGWHHFVITLTRDTSTTYVPRIYKNGVLQTTGSSFSYTNDFNGRLNYISGWNYPATQSNSPDLYMESLGFWNRVLNQSDVDKLYNSGSGRKYLDLLSL